MAAVFVQPLMRRVGVATAKQTQGKQLSYNNINDTKRSFQ